MHPLLYVMLIAGGTLAHYRGGYDTRNLVERDESETEDGVELVECPVCENGSRWMSRNEECSIVRDGKTYKRCKFGAYNNKACGNRRDCFRGARERCTEKMAEDLYDQRCAPGFYCNPAMKVCTGVDYALDSNMVWFVDNPNHRYRSDHRLPSSDLRYPIRARRDA